MRDSLPPRGFDVGEPVPCPNCQALLRLPDGASTVRCPSCKAVLEIDPDDEAAPVPPRAAAIPLPFGRPLKPPPAPAPTRPAPAARGKPVKARVAPDDPYTAAPDESVSEDDREREVRRQLRELDAAERKSEDRFEVLAAECANARTGLRLVGVGAVLSVVSAFFAIFFIVGGVAGAPFVAVAGVGGAFLLLHWVATAVGFGFCLAGPRDMRGTAAIGAALTLGHLALCALAAVAGIAPAVGMDMLQDRDQTDSFLFAMLFIGNGSGNLTVVSDLPYYALYPTNVRWYAVGLLVAAAALEFAKLSTVGLIANQFAAAAKSPDLGHASMRFVYRIFGIVLLAPILKAIAAFAAPATIVWVPMLLTTVGYNLWWAFAWYSQFQVMGDIEEIVTPVRLMDRRQRYDVV